ncbi:hypothetical protein JX265_006029 [Neoarthrinium moseri]|uniref:RING-type domain-containing protein n=1 Tax=Neoarthrinium moseri TaxID=1658444 RepID=A0A9Q0APW3_9PEZI|nr:uncharacterized protein JN550_004247 [Neoarthrinium moseri]KAI1855626.1 hypothetical protein JX266_000491 [Neoarthrinium moseri]KAI1870989.1 hypothetical protein JX265_006029 [Neoarthrinium moseri]KAI1872044.1 hypothetical protein JN550_004247 [Neoarthrinium moseri]
MSLEHVLLFSNPWLGGIRGSSTILRNITSLSSAIAYSDRITENITTLSTNYAASDGIIQGLLYTPDIDPDDPCSARASQYIPNNATKQENLPPTSYNLIALAPWIDPDCTYSLLTSTRADQLRAFIFYLPGNDTSQPPGADDAVWKLDNSSTGNSWIAKYRYPIYVVPSATGSRMMHELSLYSGNLTQVPYGANITELYHPDSADYVRIWTELRVSFDNTPLPIWAYVLIICGVVLLILGSTSLMMHWIQNRRRASLRRRVKSGEVDLEALGVKRLTVPPEHILNFPLFTYNYDPPTSPMSPTSPYPEDVKAAYTATSSHGAFPRGSILPTDYQPKCHICLDDFESKVTIIRELTCGHIFHPECIDEFLGEISSLCPICKKSMLPRGYAPKITNGMVRRERATRRLRPRIVAPATSEEPRQRVDSWGSTVKRHLRSAPSSPTLSKHPVIELPERAKDPETARQRMRELADPIDDRSDDGNPPWKRAVAKVFPWP